MTFSFQTEASDSEDENDFMHSDVKLPPSYVRNYFTPPNSVYEAEIDELQSARLRIFQEESRKSHELYSSLFDVVDSPKAPLLKNRAQLLRDRDRILSDKMFKLKESYVQKQDEEFSRNMKIFNDQLEKDFQTARLQARIEKAQAEERARKEKEAKAKEAEEKRKKELERKIEEEKRRAEEQKKADQANKNIASPSLSPNLQNQTLSSTASDKGKPKPRVSINAVKEEKNRVEKYEKMMAEISPYFNQLPLMKEKKALQRKLVVHLQQVSFSQQQIVTKIKEISDLFSQTNHSPALFGLIFSEKLLSQFESSVQNSSFVFSMAHVVVSLSKQFPIILEMFFAKLNQVCPFSVPKYFVYSTNNFATEDEYLELSGYQKKDDGKWESSSDYIGRMSSYISLFAAIIQTDHFSEPNNPNGISMGWKWISAFLNNLPPNKFTANALYSFLKVAGYRLHQVYPSPFLKVLRVIYDQYLADLKKLGDEDTKPVQSRLDTYITGHQYRDVPEGRVVPVKDVSSYYRA